jgi:hypothetical protein
MPRPLQSLSLRQAIVTRLRADADLTGLVPAASIYGQRSPSTVTWPFVRYGAPDETPLRKGTDIRVTLHAFSNEQFEDEASNILAAIQASLEAAVIDLGGGLTAYLNFLRATVMGDGAEADAFHGVISFDAAIG